MFIMRYKESSHSSWSSYTITDESTDNNEISHESAETHRWYSKKSVGTLDFKLNFAKKAFTSSERCGFPGSKSSTVLVKGTIIDTY
jgi:hypothetical protein